MKGWSIQRRAEREVRRGDAARDRGNWVEAAHAYREVVTLAPALTPIWLQYGHALKESGQPHRAEQAYRMAIAQAGGDADAHLQLGHLLKLESRFAEAAGEYCTAYLLDPTRNEAREELAALGYDIADAELPRRLQTLEQQVDGGRAALEAAATARRDLEQRLQAVHTDLLEAQEIFAERERHWTAAREAAKSAAWQHDELERQRAALATSQANLAEQRARVAALEQRAARDAAIAAAPRQDAAASPVAGLISYSVSDLKDPELLEYASVGYLKINGWGINDYLATLFLAIDAYQKDRGILGNLFEIGVFHGRVLILLGLMSRPEERVVGLDIFEALQSHNIDASGGFTTKEIVEQHLESYRLHDKTDLIVGDSLFTDFSKNPTLSNIRFAHIDGAHYVDAVVNDLMKTQQLMVPGGIIVVDDFLHVGFPGVNEGCHRFLSLEMPRLVVPFAAGANKLFLTTHSHHADLLGYLRDILIPPNGKPIKIHGFDAVSLERD